MTYKTYYIKDSKIEDIECIFYSFIRFLSETLAETPPKRVLVHCVQGVSRSVTLTMAFLMHSFSLSFRQCFSFVKQRRGVASPNLGFVSQLLDFERRLKTLRASHPSVPNQPSSPSSRTRQPNNTLSKHAGQILAQLAPSPQLVSPRDSVLNRTNVSSLANSVLPAETASIPKTQGPIVFCLGSHQLQDPSFLVFRRINHRKMFVNLKGTLDHFFGVEREKCRQTDQAGDISERFLKADFKLDPRGIFLVIGTEQPVQGFLWKGNVHIHNINKHFPFI